MRILSFILAAFIISNSAVAQQKNPRTKNILLIYADDHSYHALGAAEIRKFQHRTSINLPNLD